MLPISARLESDTNLTGPQLLVIMCSESALADLLLMEPALAVHLKRHFLHAEQIFRGGESAKVDIHSGLESSFCRLLAQFELDETHPVIVESLLEMGKAVLNQQLSEACKLLTSSDASERKKPFKLFTLSGISPVLWTLLGRVPSCMSHLFEAVTKHDESFVRPLDETGQLINLLTAILEPCPILDLSVFRWFGNLVEAEQACLARYIAAGPAPTLAKEALDLLVECKKMSDFYRIGVSIDREAACRSVRDRSFEQVSPSVKQEWMVTVLEFLEETEEEQEGSELSRAADYLRG